MARQFLGRWSVLRSLWLCLELKYPQIRYSLASVTIFHLTSFKNYNAYYRKKCFYLDQYSVTIASQMQIVRQVRIQNEPILSSSPTVIHPVRCWISHWVQQWYILLAVGFLLDFPTTEHRIRWVGHAHISKYVTKGNTNCMDHWTEEKKNWLKRDKSWLGQAEDTVKLVCERTIIEAGRNGHQFHQSLEISFLFLKNSSRDAEIKSHCSRCRDQIQLQ